MIVGLLHPGEMGASIGGVLRGAGVAVRWAGEGRSAETLGRAQAAGLDDVRSVKALAGGCDVLLVICPPHGAVGMARAVADLDFQGIYVDANAVSPATASHIAGIVTAAGARFVDGDLIGGPVRGSGGPRVFLSGPDARAVADLFSATPVTAKVIGDGVEASALKMCYAAWTKGTSALLLAIRALAQASGVDAALLEEWSRSQPDLAARCDAAVDVAGRGWRFAGEMAEIGNTFEAAGLPAGFGLAPAEVYQRLAPFKGRRPSGRQVWDALGG